MTESLEVKVARIEEKVDQVLRRLEVGDQNFAELKRQLAEHDRHINRLYGGIALATFLVPIIVAVILRFL